MNQLRVLIVEDDESVRKLIAKILSNDGMLTYQAETGTKALALLEQNQYDLIILDIILPDISGYEVAKQIRYKDLKLPTIFLSGMTDEADIIKGLDMGADTYLTKPFSPSLLSAHVKSKIRRIQEISHAPIGTSQIIRGPFRLDLKTYRFYKRDMEIKLTSKEIKLMKFFMENPHHVFSKDELYQHVWQEISKDGNSITVYVRYLRNKIEDDPQNPKYLKTVWGIGYQFVA